MRLCKDCRYFQEASDKEAFCSHEAAIMFDDPVYGEHSKKTCHEMRLHNNANCGRLGRLWTAKPEFSITNFNES